MTAPAAIREQILSQGLTVASLQGLHAVTVGELAKELDLPRSGLFSLFSTKEKLQLAILDKAAERFADTVVTPALQKPMGRRRVEALFRNWLAWARSHDLKGGCPFVHASADTSPFDTPICSRLNEVLDGWREQVLAAINEAKTLSGKDGLRADLDGEQFLFELFGLYLSHHFWHWSMKDSQAEWRTLKAFDRLMDDARAA